VFPVALPYYLLLLFIVVVANALKALDREEIASAFKAFPRMIAPGIGTTRFMAENTVDDRRRATIASALLDRIPVGVLSSRHDSFSSLIVRFFIVGSLDFTHDFVRSPVDFRFTGNLERVGAFILRIEAIGRAAVAENSPGSSVR
jgi:hypothetical protein